MYHGTRQTLLLLLSLFFFDANATHSSSASVKSTRFATAAEGGLCGNNAGLNKGQNLCDNFAISLGTKATDSFLVLSTSVAANVFLGCG